MKAIFADLQKQQAESGREVVSLSRKQDTRTRWRGQGRHLGGDAPDVIRHST
ncbi:MAG: hypothetical protein ACK4WN_01600 [Aphanizomenon sp.]